MAMRLFLVYVLVEMAVIVALTYTIGFGWTVLLLAAAFALGIALAGSQVRGQIAQLQRGMRDPGRPVTDSALVALGSVLVVIPGLVTSAAGLLMLLPPTRAAMRPLAGVLATRALARRIAFVDLPGRGPVRRGGRTSTARSSTCTTRPVGRPARRTSASPNSSARRRIARKLRFSGDDAAARRAYPQPHASRCHGDGGARRHRRLAGQRRRGPSPVSRRRGRRPRRRVRRAGIRRQPRPRHRHRAGPYRPGPARPPTPNSTS